jgi:hypothetical protein
VAEANVWNFADGVVVNAGIFPANNLIIHTGDLTITGAGADTTSVNGGDAGRVFQVNSGITATLSALTIEDGNAGSGNGGGLLNMGKAILDGVRLTGNNARHGAGIYSSGNLTVQNSTLDNNGAFSNFSGSGGGIYNASFGVATLSNSTISGNSAWNQGGGIYQGSIGSLTMDHVTVADNLATTGSGGGVVKNGSGAFYLTNSLIADNESSGTTAEECAGIFTTLTSQSLVEAITFACSISGGFIAGDPNLQPLDFYGGSTPVHELNAGSLAIDAAGTETQTADQHNNPRPAEGDGDGGAMSDLGAMEFCGSAAPIVPDVAVALSATDVTLSWTAQGGMVYEVWRSDVPYFAIGDVGAVLVDTTMGGVVVNAGILTPNTPIYYHVRTTNDCGVAVTTPVAIGVFMFDIVPGS